MAKHRATHKAHRDRRCGRDRSNVETVQPGDGFLANPVALDCRSRMNVPFILADAALDKTFLEESAAEGLANLKGHRSVGGMRASIYNAVTEEAVEALIGFMAEFERKYG